MYRAPAPPLLLLLAAVTSGGRPVPRPAYGLALVACAAPPAASITPLALLGTKYLFSHIKYRTDPAAGRHNRSPISLRANICKNISVLNFSSHPQTSYTCTN